MKKRILKSNGTVEVMDFEMVVESYKNLVARIAKRYKGLYITEDDMQEGYLGLWRAFMTYDEEHCFSTHATWKIRQRFHEVKSRELAARRSTMGKTFVNMEFDLGDGNQVGDMIEDKNAQFEEDVLNSDFITYIKTNLNESEMDLLAYNFGYVKAEDLAKKYNIGISGITNRNARFKVKLEKLISDYNK